jgi:hypothetical protein
VVQPPVAQKAGALLDGFQLGMAERIGVALATVAAPANAAQPLVEQCSGYRHLTATTHLGSPTQEPGHPQL